MHVFRIRVHVPTELEPLESIALLMETQSVKIATKGFTTTTLFALRTCAPVPTEVDLPECQPLFLVGIMETQGVTAATMGFA